MDSGYESDDEPMSTDILEDIRYGIQSHPNVNSREACYKICECIMQRQPEWKGALKATRNMGNILHKVFKTAQKEISQALPPLGESGSEVPISFHNPETFLKLPNF